MRIIRTHVINNIVNKYHFKRYLEIGVSLFDNFNKINIPYKVSVDPGDYAKYDYNVTSDEFFANNKETFDCIFLDGLHEGKQIYRDIKNALKVLEPNGVIIIHDVNAITRNHTIRESPSLALGKGSFTGDVYQGFCKAKKELKDWSCFSVNITTGCGIITQNPLLKNIQNAYKENMDWDYFNAHRTELLQLISYSEYKELLK